MKVLYEFRFIAVTVILLSSHSVHAGAAHVDCREPIVFPRAAVNVVVLPYRYTGANQPALTNSGKRLALLVKLDSLFNMLPYGSVGAVQMEIPENVTDDRSCQPDVLLQKLLSEKPVSIQDGLGLVLIWGLIYEEGDQIFVQTFTRFLRKGYKEEIKLQVEDAVFSGQPSSQAVSFPTHQISQTDLDQIEESFSRADFIRTQKRDDAPGEPLFRPARCVGSGCEDPNVHSAYAVDQSEGDWIHVTLQNPGGNMHEGWIHARVGLAGNSLDSFLPELHFIRGVAGYLRQRTGEDHAASPAPEGTRELALREFSMFDESMDAEDAELAVAVSKQLAGMMRLSASRQPREVDLAAAAKYFNDARALVPYSADATTLAAVARISQDSTKPGNQSATKAERELVEAASLSTSQPTALQNLKSFYGLVAKSNRYAGIDKEESQRRIETLKRIEKLPRTQIFRPIPQPETRPTTEKFVPPQSVNPKLPPPERPNMTPAPLPPSTEETKRSQSSVKQGQQQPAQQRQQPQSKGTILAQNRANGAAAYTKEPPAHSESSSADLVAVYNLHDISSPVYLTPDILAAIFGGKIQRWDDANITKVNPLVKLPAIPIVVIFPTPEAGVDAAFSDYLAKKDHIWDKQPNSPRGSGLVRATLTTDELVSAVKSQPGSISILSLSSAEAGHLQHGSVLH